VKEAIKELTPGCLCQNFRGKRNRVSGPSEHRRTRAAEKEVKRRKRKAQSLGLNEKLPAKVAGRPTEGTLPCLHLLSMSGTGKETAPNFAKKISHKQSDEKTRKWLNQKGALLQNYKVRLSITIKHTEWDTKRSMEPKKKEKEAQTQDLDRWESSKIFRGKEPKFRP